MSFAKENIKVLHLELTTRCNASCPQCSRMDPSTKYTEDYDLTLDRIKELFSEEFVRQLDKVFACGDFGDPAAAKNCLPILEWFREVNPDITLGMNTNGGPRNGAWWHILGKLFSKPKDYVVFSIDGLADTNHIYRVNVNWGQVMHHAEIFINAGGSAHWDMLVYEHNEHQVEECKKLAKDMGFTWFRCKVSSRFATHPVEFLKAPKGFSAVIDDGPVKCHALNEKSLYVAATGKLMPCCFMGHKVFTLTEPLRGFLDEPDFKSISEALATTPLTVCKEYCSTNNNVNRLDNQFRENTQL
jgi:hypothetical protein